MKRIFRDRLAGLLLESLVPSGSPGILQFLATAIRLLEQESRGGSLPCIPLARLEERLGCSPDIATWIVQRLVLPPALIAISESPQGEREIALAKPLRDERAELIGTLEGYLAAAEAFGRISLPAESLERAFVQARICYNLGLFFEAHEILEHAWLPLAKGPLRTFMQGIIQISVGFHHARRGSYAGAVNQLGKGLEKLGRTLAEAPDPAAEAFRQPVESVRNRLREAGRERMVALSLCEIPPMTFDLPASLRGAHS